MPDVDLLRALGHRRRQGRPASPEQDGEEPNLFGVWKSNFNSLVPHFNVGKLGFGAPYKGVMCNVRRVRSLDQD